MDERSSVPFNVMPASVPPEFVPSRAEVPVVATVPPVIDPPKSWNVPVLPFRLRVFPVLSNAPVTSTVPELDRLPMAAVLNEPPSSRAELASADRLPALVQVPLKVALPPPVASMVPAFDQ